MSTFNELCNDVAEESGTMGGRVISTVSDLTGRPSQVVGWVKEAYQDIQQLHNNWRWMRADFSASLTSGIRTYDAAALGITDRFGGWIWDQDQPCRDVFSIYKTSDGQSFEGFMTPRRWDWFRRSALYGSAATEIGHPQLITFDADDAIQVHPIPDGTYTFRGSYWKAPQILTADGDIPEMPVQFHRLIKWRALEKLAFFDEEQNLAATYKFNGDPILEALERAMLPRIRVDSEPLDEQ